jgi:hypothetical protein
MRPQFFPWLFDDKNAWEKAFADPRYSYDLPIDNFTAIYQVERKVDDANFAMRYALPELSAPITPTSFAPAPAPAFLTATAAPAAAAPKQEASKREEGILSQEEIDALLSGL